MMLRSSAPAPGSSTPAQPSACHAYPRAARQLPKATPGPLALALVLLGLSSGCTTHTGVSLQRPGAAKPVSVTGDARQLPAPGIALQVSPGDKLRIRIQPLRPAPAEAVGTLLAAADTVSYSFNYQPGQYRILPGDQLAIRFAADKKLDLDPIVRPDGRIGLGLVPDEIEASGKTPAELAALIETATRSRLQQPGVSVLVTKANLPAAELTGEATLQADGSLVIPRLGRFPAAGLTPTALAQTLSQAASQQWQNPLVAQVVLVPANRQPPSVLIGSDLLAEVSADGALTLPELGTFDVNGLTVTAVRDLLQTSLDQRYPNPLSIIVALEASAARVVYVDGEVARAGAYPLTASLTTLRAIALAGGIRETGDLKSVVVIHRDTPTTATVYITNLKEVFAKAAAGNDLALAPQDIVLVPRTSIAKANLWVDQYITRLLPFSRGVSYSYVNGTTKTDGL